MDKTDNSMEIDSEVDSINFTKDCDPFLPVIPSPRLPEEIFQETVKTPPVTPMHSPYPFLREETLFSPPPHIPREFTESDGISLQNPTRKQKTTTRPKPYILPLKWNNTKRKSKKSSIASLLKTKTETLKEPSKTDRENTEALRPTPVLLIRPIHISKAQSPITWNPPSLLQIVSRPTPDLVR